jgi:rod shape-determining protein MreC
MKEMAYANERFQRLLQFREKISSPVIAAEVIGGDPSSWFKSITLNKGENEGIRRGNRKTLRYLKLRLSF